MSEDMPELLPFKPFALGTVVMTHGFLGLIGEIDQARAVGCSLVDMHASGDFGKLSDDDRLQNLRALHDPTPGRIFSAYLAGKEMQKVYVITEHDRSSTTIMLADEY